MILVDSSVWIDYFRGISSPQTDLLDELFESKKIIVGDIILTEVLQGFDSEKQFRETLDIFKTVPMIRVGGYDTAVAAARNYRKLRKLGFTVRKTVDTLIATSCILQGYELLHNDRDFIPFEKHLGLQSVKY